MKLRMLFRVLLGLCVLGLLATGCSKKKSAVVAPQSLDANSVNQVILNAGKLPPKSDDKDVVTDSSAVDNGAFRTITVKHDAAKNVEEITYLGLNDDVVFPGNLVKGDKLHDFVYPPITGVTRNPITLSINLENSGMDSLSQVINDPKLSTVREGISALLNRALTSGAHYAAKAQFEQTQVWSESQLNLVVGADLKYGGATANTDFNWTSTSQRTKLIAKYQQFYYTIDMDTPASPAALFAGTNSLDQVKAAMPAGSCPVYVAGVTYGMMALTFIESDYSASDIKQSLNAAYSGMGLDVALHDTLTMRTVLANSSIRTVVYGGNSAGLDQIEAGYQGFIKVVHSSIQLGTASPGVPLLYKFRFLSDNTLAAVTLTSQYSITQIIRLQQQVRIIADKFHCVWADDDCGDDVLEIVHLALTANGLQHKVAGDIAVTTCKADTIVYEYWGSGYGHQMNDGSDHVCGTSVVLEFDAEHFDYNLASLRLLAYVLDAEPGLCENDPQAVGQLVLTSGDFSQSIGHTVHIYASDYEFTCELHTELANRPQAVTYHSRRR